MNEVINITPSPNLSTSNVGDIGTIKLNNLPPLSSPKKSVNFGPGVEMLMNDKRRSSSPKSDIKLSDLESLDTKINLTDTKTSSISRKDATAAMFGTTPKAGITLNVTEKPVAPALGAASAKDPC